MGAALTALVAGSGPAAATPATPAFGPLIDAYATNQPQSSCDPTAKPGVIDFREIVLRAYPGTRDSGITRACDVGGTSEHKEGRAWDWGVRVSAASEKAAAEGLLRWILATDGYGNRHANARRLGLMYIIWNRQIWKAYGSRMWEPYSGVSPHTDHVHFSFSWAGARRQTTWWGPSPTGGSRRRADFTGDGRADLLYQDTWGSTFELLTSTGTAFAAAGPFAGGMAIPAWEVSGDFNGDGRADIAYQDNNSREIRVLTSGGTRAASSSAWAGGMAMSAWRIS